jgi:thiol-disulfide isomerase/thioredoxin
MTLCGPAEEHLRNILLTTLIEWEQIMTAQRYRVLFEGQIIPGHDVQTVKKNLAVIFRLGHEKMERFFSGRRFVIKKDLDQQSAQKYEEAFRRAGATCIVEPVEIDPGQELSGLRLENDTASPPQSDLMICPSCNVEQAQSTECVRCGIIVEKFSEKPLEQDFKSESERIEEDFSAFIGKNAHKYLSKFSKFNIGGTDNFAITWNWPAFFFGWLWMLYRKLYLWALVAFVLELIPYTSLFGLIGFAMSGNYLYYKHAKKKIDDLKTSRPSSDLSSSLRQVGGVNRWVVTVAMVLIVLGVAGGFYAGVIPMPIGGQDTIGKISFYTDYDTGLDQAYETGKPVMLVFSASWCGACKAMIRDVFSNDEVADASQQLVNIYIDVDEADRQLVNQYNVKYVPSVFFLDYSGDTVITVGKDRSPKDFISNIDYVAMVHSYSG